MIILPKNNSDINLGMKKQIKQLFENLFNNVNDSSFEINLDNNVKIEYKISSKEKNMVFLKLSCNATPARAAKYLDSVTNRLIQGEHRKTWNIVISYDEVSQLYCCKLMPLFGIFERRIRELVYITIIKIFGVEWYDNSFSKSLQDAMKGKGNKTKMVESALNELTYEQLKEYLFTPFCGRNISEVLEQELSESSVEELSKEEILDIVNQCRSESLWNRFFSEYKQFRNIKEKIDELQPHRNTVMHNKRMTQNEYEKVRKSLKNINKLLVEAINVLEKDIYTETKLVDVVSALGTADLITNSPKVDNAGFIFSIHLGIDSPNTLTSIFPKIDVSSVIPSLEIGNAMSAQMEQIRKQYQVVGNIAEQVNFAKRLENAGNQMAIAAAKQSAIYNNSMLSKMGNLSQISKIDYTPAMDVARELSERNQRFANSLGINGMLGETVDTDKEDDDKDKNP